jgi:hypothetical protein
MMSVVMMSVVVMSVVPPFYVKCDKNKNKCQKPSTVTEPTYKNSTRLKQTIEKSELMLGSLNHSLF